jgi:hypothetical protein
MSFATCLCNRLVAFKTWRRCFQDLPACFRLVTSVLISSHWLYWETAQFLDRTNTGMVESDAPLGIEACSCLALVCDFRLMLCDGPIPDARRPTKCLKIGLIGNLLLLSLILTEENLLTNLKFNYVSDNYDRHEIRGPRSGSYEE